LTADPAPWGDPRWIAQRDLIESSGGDQHFVAEIDNDGRAHLRFGDGELGRRPEAGMKFQAAYRAGGGTAGNVGAEAISRLVTRVNALSGGVVGMRNPLPAAGGSAPEPLAEVKLFAPHAFRQELQRAVIADDYAAIAQRDFSAVVQRAAATLRWSGSWYEAVVAVDQFGKEQADDALLHEIAKDLYRYRRMGHDVRVESARLVPLDIAMTVCVKPHYLRGHVKAALLDLFSARVLPDGNKGFFHPDNLSFGEGIYLSKLVASAQAVTGVESVKVTKLKRLFECPDGEIESGVLHLGPLEVAELENDPSFPEHGKFALTVGGGR
jgi:predicted phage baseplate assembly protein